MVTGDNLITARSIARKCGILAPDGDDTGDHILEGKTFSKLVHDDNGTVSQLLSSSFFSSFFSPLILLFLSILCEKKIFLFFTEAHTQRNINLI